MGQLKNAQENREFIPLAHGAWVPFPLRKHDLISVNHLIHREFFQLLEKHVPPVENLPIMMSCHLALHPTHLQPKVSKAICCFHRRREARYEGRSQPRIRRVWGHARAKNFAIVGAKNAIWGGGGRWFGKWLFFPLLL